ncbi:MAG: hypothetical protein F4Z77_03385 [Dehalococcoidia bacterium]|nr:hypothetical protein [Dehalococcoidia bacterium]MYA51938.1 hypothetical protein [Dehalococcoidia bacterium]
MAVAVDRPFFEALVRASEEPSHDLDAGDGIWMVLELVADGSGSYRLRRGHWEAAEIVDFVDHEGCAGERERQAHDAGGDQGAAKEGAVHRDRRLARRLQAGC